MSVTFLNISAALRLFENIANTHSNRIIITYTFSVLPLFFLFSIIYTYISSIYTRLASVFCDLCHPCYNCSKRNKNKNYSFTISHEHTYTIHSIFKCCCCYWIYIWFLLTVYGNTTRPIVRVKLFHILWQVANEWRVRVNHQLIH